MSRFVRVAVLTVLGLVPTRRLAAQSIRQAFGNIMQVFSTSESHRDSSDAHPRRGINSIQLFNEGARWWVVGVLWDNEGPGKTIPAEFLKPHG